MACLRREAPEGRLGVVQCSEEGCKLRRITDHGGSWFIRDTPEADCVLQLRLRAGDVEDTDPEQQRIDDEERRFMELISRGENPYNPDGSIKVLTQRSIPRGITRERINDARRAEDPDTVNVEFDFNKWLRSEIRNLIREELNRELLEGNKREQCAYGRTPMSCNIRDCRDNNVCGVPRIGY